MIEMKNNNATKIIRIDHYGDMMINYKKILPEHNLNCITIPYASDIMNPCAFMMLQFNKADSWQLYIQEYKTVVIPRVGTSAPSKEVPQELKYYPNIFDHR